MKTACCSGEFLPEKSENIRRSVLDILLEKDVLILGCGSLSCLSGLYRGMVQRSMSHRFVPCYITDREYALGRSEDVLLDCLRRTLKTCTASGIILYASCTEVMIGCDYTRLLRRLGDTGSIIVRPFLRGPLLARRENIGAKARALVADLPPAKAEPYGPPCLPVPSADFDGIYGQAVCWGIPCVLLSPGGCSGGLTRAPGETCVITRFNDLFVGAPDWKGLLTQCASLYGAQSKPLFLKTAISELLLPRGTETLAGERWTFAPCSGRHSAALGLSDYLLAETVRWSRDRDKRAGLVCAFGHSRFLTQEDSGDLALTDWSPGLEALPGRSVVLSSAGLAAARYLYEQYGIPYKVDACLAEDRIHRLASALPPDSGQQICICGDPVVVNSISEGLLKRRPGCAIRKLLYCPVRSDRSFYEEFSDFLLIDGSDTLDEALENSAALVSAPGFAPWLRAVRPECRWIPL